MVSRGSSVELFRIDGDGLKLVSLLKQPAFAVVRSLQAFRMTGGNKDYCAVGSDSGKITILEYLPDKGILQVVHCETYGKTGCRRIVPGEYISADPQGRALMIGALEKQKFVYIMNRDASSRLTISSPLEAHKGQAVCLSICALDVAFDNPVFAALEIDYSDADMDPTGEAAAAAEKHLVYYQLDLGLNHVVRSWSDPVSRTASLLLQVPGGAQGPSGVLVCSENWVSYKHQDHPEVRATLPRREGQAPSRGTLVTSGALHKQKNMFFHLLQSEYGDLYKVTLDLDAAKKNVKGLSIEVFDTVAVSRSLSISRTGLLFCASEFANHMLFQFSSLGGEGAVTATACMDDTVADDSVSAAAIAPTFQPKDTLTNLWLVDELESLAPVTDLMIGDLTNELTPQVYAACGAGNRSSLRILRHGLAVSEMAVSELPGRPGSVWALKERVEDPFIKYIVVSFANATLVLTVGDTVEEVQDSGFLATSPTLETTLLANNSILQVHGGGLRVIAPGKPPQEWRVPGRKVVEKACANARQAAIALAGGEIIYFALDDAMTGLQEVGTVEMGAEVSCLEMGKVPDGRIGAPFLAVGDWSGTVKLLSLSSDSLLAQLSLITAPASPESLCLVEMLEEGVVGDRSATGASSSQLHLFVGLSNGVMQRASVDATSGALSDTRTRFCGASPVKVFRMPVGGTQGVLALSTRSWLTYFHQGRHITSPLSYDPLAHASEFSTEHCPEGIVAISDSSLRIVSVDRLGEAFNQRTIPLRYTPRQIAQLPGPRLLVVEADTAVYSEAELAALKSGEDPEKIEAEAAAGDGDGSAPPPPPPPPPPAGGDDMDMDVDMDMDADGPPAPPPPPPEDGAEANVNGENGEGEEEEEEAVKMPLRGPIPRRVGKWASCITLIHPTTEEILQRLELSHDEAAISVATVLFHSRGGEPFVAVGTTRGLTHHPTASKSSYVRVYRVMPNSGDLILLHKTEMSGVPLALCEFQGRLLVGAGRTLRMYDLGKKKLLRKCESRVMPTAIASVCVSADRIVVADMAESLHFLKYRKAENQLVVFADDTVPRWVTKAAMLDYDTAVGGDKFGNIFVLRVPEDASDDVENPTGSRVLWDTGMLNGAPSKVSRSVCHSLISSSFADRHYSSAILHGAVLHGSCRHRGPQGTPCPGRIGGHHLLNYRGQHWSTAAILEQRGCRLFHALGDAHASRIRHAVPTGSH